VRCVDNCVISVMMGLLTSLCCSPACCGICGGPALPPSAGPLGRVRQPAAAAVWRRLHASGRAARPIPGLHCSQGALCRRCPPSRAGVAQYCCWVPPTCPPRTPAQLWGQQPLGSIVAGAAEVAVAWCGCLGGGCVPTMRPQLVCSARVSMAHSAANSSDVLLLQER
jgi:hypothetical protein